MKRTDSFAGRTLAAIAVLAIGMINATEARTEIRVDINRGTIKPLPIAIPVFSGTSGEAIDYGQQLADVISANLERSGIFAPIDRAAFLQRFSSLDMQPRFAEWRGINAQALVVGGTRLERDGRLRVEFRLWDVFSSAQLTGLRLVTPPGNWRRVAHLISDEIYKRVTGENGYFDTRIVYIAESGSAKRRIKRLAIMDQDGANHRFLTNGRWLVLTPRFSPTAPEVTYLSYEAGLPRVYLRNIDTGRQEVVGEFPGMTFAPRFSPDGNRVVMSMSQDGNSEIYSMDLRTRRVERLTTNPAIDTSPCYSPDGRRIVFNSTRGGSQQLYVMDARGGNARRISFGDGRYATPVWSPRGDLIAFTRINRSLFSIGVMRPDGSGERILTQGYLVEGPTWSPNGRVLMYFKQKRNAGTAGGEAKLYSIDLTGHNEREISTPVGGSDPAWSPPAK